MKRKHFVEALLTQIPIFGGIVVYKKLIDIENELKKNKK